MSRRSTFESEIKFDMKEATIRTLSENGKEEKHGFI